MRNSWEEVERRERKGKAEDAVLRMNRLFEIRDKEGRITYLTKERWSHIRNIFKLSSFIKKKQKTI